ncbi:hypothetical protein ABW20_dc0107101 [Dactylellina cionopaga]|nr:hypothetical protein ABW20_dc0107101 [Dactylellina cionopaga]
MASYENTPFYRYTDPDVTLVVGEWSPGEEEQREFKVHENVLAPQSEFFKAALTSGFRETQEKRVELPGIKPETMVNILEWVYRAEIWVIHRTISRTQRKTNF